METTPWDFMSPWMDILRPYASVRPIAKVQSFGGAPSFVSCVECINLSFPATVPQVEPPEIEENRDFQEWPATSVLTREELVALRAAIGLASRALLISPQLWSAFSDASGSRREDHYFEPRVFRDEDLVPMFEIDSRCWSGEGVAFDVWLTYVKTIFESEEDPRFLTDMQKIEKLDPLELARACNGRARVSLRASLMTEAHLEEFVETLEQFLTRSTPPTLELAGVHLSAKEITSTVIKCLSRLRQLSVIVSSFVVITGTRTRLVSRALAVLQVPELSQKLEVCIARNGTLPCLANSALLDRNAPGFMAVRLDAVNLRFDWKLFNSVIHRACIRIPSQRLYFRLPTLWGEKLAAFASGFSRTKPLSNTLYFGKFDPTTRIGEQMMTENGISESQELPVLLGATDALVQMPDNNWKQVPVGTMTEIREEEAKQALVECSNQLGPSVSLRIDTPTRLPAVIAWMIACFSACGLSSLDLQVVKGVNLTDDIVREILLKFPKLKCFQLGRTDLASLQVFVDGYRSGYCSLRVLSVEVFDVGTLSLIEELCDSDSHATSLLRELRINFPEDHDGAYLSRVDRMLTLNRELECLELMLFQQTNSSVARIADTLRPYDRSALCVRIPRRVKLAFLSVLTESKSLSVRRFDSLIVGTILRCCAPYRKRFVVVKWVKDSHLVIARGMYGSRHLIFTNIEPVVL